MYLYSNGCGRHQSVSPQFKKFGKLKKLKTLFALPDTIAQRMIPGTRGGVVLNGPCAGTGKMSKLSDEKIERKKKIKDQNIEKGI